MKLRRSRIEVIHFYKKGKDFEEEENNGYMKSRRGRKVRKRKAKKDKEW